MPNNWKKYKLGDSGIDILDGDRGKNYPSQNEFYKKEYCLFLSTRNVTLNSFQFDECQFITKEKDLQLRKGKLQRNDIVITTRGTIGNIGFYNENVPFDNIRINSGMVILRFLNKEYLPKFYHHFFKSKAFSVQVSNYVSGSAQPQLPIKDLKCIEIPLPPLPEQQAIAEILSSLDDKIELNLQTNKTLEEMANALYKHWFVDFGPFLPSGRWPQDGRGQIPGFVESELGLIPEGWEVKKIKDTYDISIGRTPPRKESEWFTLNNEDVKWISIKDMGICGTYIYNTSEYITRDAIKKHNIPVIPTNTVVLSFKLTVGRITITTEDMLSNEAIAHFIPSNSNYLTTEFTYLFLKNFDYNSLGSTSSIATAVNSQTIKNINILYPNKKTITEFKLIVENLFNQIKQNTLETETLKKTRDYLLPKLISGEIRVKDAAKKVKEVL